MKITNNLNIVKKTNGEWVVNGEIATLSETDREFLSMVYDRYRNMYESNRESDFNSIAEVIVKDNPNVATLLGIITNAVAEAVENEAPKELTDEEKKKATLEAVKKLMQFFTEFEFEPNFRFVNTLALSLKQSEKKAKDYITNYFELTDSPFKKEVVQKMKSAEFTNILKDMALTEPTKVINNRFKLYYGSQGTGKTTIGMKETDKRCIVCNSSMLPADLMEDFVFVEGKATFKPSSLWRCMTEGKPIVLDEINLLPFDSLRFLQGILDGKASFEYKGNTVEIKEGFKIIGTMNLTVNGMTYGLPEPLVDRCEETKKFKLTATDLINAI